MYREHHLEERDEERRVEKKVRGRWKGILRGEKRKGTRGRQSMTWVTIVHVPLAPTLEEVQGVQGTNIRTVSFSRHLSKAREQLRLDRLDRHTNS